ncbi:MAG: hypothetical protein IKP66_04315 [Lachnospiraceae bacterium]|nr:hypothetical protein [Lachnospiraceae bacterium]
MTKTRIKEILKEHNTTMIRESYYSDKEGISFNAYDDRGDCYSFWINTTQHLASRRKLSAVSLFAATNITNWFYYKGKEI